jgi:hypothetical protein
MMMEDAKIYNEDIYAMYMDFKGAFNAADHRIVFKRMRQLGIPPPLSTHANNHMVSPPQTITPLRPHPSIDIYRTVGPVSLTP